MIDKVFSDSTYAAFIRHLHKKNMTKTQNIGNKTSGMSEYLTQVSDLEFKPFEHTL